MLTLWLKCIFQGLRTIAPYLFVELLLPGGTFVALLLWLSQEHKAHAVPSKDNGLPHCHTYAYPLSPVIAEAESRTPTAALFNTRDSEGMPA